MNEYFRLVRLYNLTGAWLLFLPSLWVIAMLSKNLSDLIWIPIFFLGSIVMRSAGCIINDFVDREIDNKVERTKDRPLANKRLKPLNAIFLLIFLLSIGFFILLFIGEESIKLGLLVMALIIIYPFGKRFFKYPQILLAIIFNSGALFASIAISGLITTVSIFMYIGSFFWILYYDTIYAHQDKIYDKDLGLYSMALTELGNEKWLNRYYKAALSLWLFSGVAAGLNFLYYIFIAGLFYIFYRQMQSINLNNPKSCMDAFKFNRNIGLILFVAIVLGRI
jgi:4-hydroxybenzoate polyprenyltransferase